jgi:dCMP deaminase
MNPKHVKFIAIADAIAQLSKDRSTKVGAIAIGPNGEIRAMGYNGMPRGCDDTAEARHVRPEKYLWFEHAERNLIYNAARVGVGLEGCTIIVSGLYPCMDCARAIVQSGIREIIAPPVHTDNRWMDMAIKSSELFKECGVITHEY